MKLTLKQGTKLVQLARNVIFDKVEEAPSEEFEEARGVFVTIYSYPKKELRGCIGFPYPTHPLWMAVTEGAKAAAFSDPRFEPLGKNEKFIIEVSVLTKPEPIKADDPEEYPKKVKIGEDGLIVEKGAYSGLLLPQVFPEWNCDGKSALGMTCEKAGLPSGEWKTGSCKIFKFQAQLFIEETPKGPIKEHILVKKG